MKTRKTMATTIVIAIACFRVATATPITIAHDTAGNSEYSDGWESGDNGGTGFEPWVLSFGGMKNELDPVYGGNSHFIDGGNVGPMPSNGLGQRAFGMTTSRRRDMASAQRQFSEPLSVGRTFSMELDGSAFEIGQFADIGNVVQLLGADGVPRYELSSIQATNGQFWKLNGTNTALRFDEPVRLTVSPSGNDRYTAGLSTLDGSMGFATFNATLPGTSGQPISGIRLQNIGTGSSMDGATEMFFDNMQVVQAVPEPALGAISILSLLSFIAARRSQR